MAEHNLSRMEDELREGPEYKGPYLSRIEKLLKDYDPGGSSYDGPYDSIEDLPETGDPKKIYLVTNGDTDDYYDEYYWDEEHSTYQPMGTTKLDLASKADDDKVVHNTGDETILGEKIFRKIKLEDDDQYGVPAQFILPSGEEAIFVNPIDNTEGTNLDLDDYTDPGIYKFVYTEQGVHNPDNIPENLDTLIGTKFYMFLEVQGRMQDSSDNFVVLQNLYVIGTDLSKNDRNNGRVLAFSRIRSLVDNSYEWSDWKRCDVDQAIIEGDTKYLKLDGTNKMTGMLEAPSAKLSTDNNNALMITANGAVGGLIFGQTTDDDTTKMVFFTVNRKNADIGIGAHTNPSSTQNGMVMHIRNQGNPNDSSIDFNFSTEFKKNLNVLGNLTVNGNPIDPRNVIFVSQLPEASANTMDKIYIAQPDVVVYDYEGDKTKIISDADYVIDYSKYSLLTFVGANYTNGDIWNRSGDAATVENPKLDDTFVIKSDGGDNTQGRYHFTATGIHRDENTWNHCGIAIITGIEKALSNPKMYTTVVKNGVYSWYEMSSDEEAEIDEIKEDLANNTTYTLDGENLVLFSLR